MVSVYLCIVCTLPLVAFVFSISFSRNDVVDGLLWLAGFVCVVVGIFVYQARYSLFFCLLFSWEMILGRFDLRNNIKINMNAYKYQKLWVWFESIYRFEYSLLKIFYLLFPKSLIILWCRFSCTYSVIFVESYNFCFAYVNRLKTKLMRWQKLIVLCQGIEFFLKEK